MRTLILIGLILFTPISASAHSGETTTTTSSSVEIMQMMEDHMMGDEQHERMEELMNELLAGTLSLEEQQEMIQIMQDPQAGPGAMTMMVRGTSPAWNTQPWNHMNWLPGSGPAYWVTIILLWALLVLGILVLGKKLTNKK